MHRVLLFLASVVAGAALTAGCSPAPDHPVPAPTPAVGPGPSDRSRLAAHAAAAGDLVGIFDYRLETPGREDRTVRVIRAEDGGWRVDVPGAALGGTVDVAVAHTGGRLFQCRLGDIAPGCVQVPRIDPDIDPMVQHVFTDWLDVLMDRAAPLAISGAPPIEGVSGSCFAVESSTVSLVVPLDTGIYCYDEEGVLTGARLSFGTLILVSGDTTGPDSIQLPGPVVEALPVPTAAPSPPSTHPASPEA